MAEIDEKLAELEGFSDYIREYQVSAQCSHMYAFRSLSSK